jgi:cobyrinic acid a,c-diamide synthase
MLAQAALEADVILIEGVMGLYDGRPSSADLARAFSVPVLAVLDVAAMAQTVGALALGLRDFGPVHLAGVIANRVASAGHGKWWQPRCATFPARIPATPGRSAA